VPDVDADRRANKWNQVAKRGREGSLKGYLVLFVLAGAAVIIASVVLHHSAYLIALLAFFMVPAAVRCARQHILDTQKLTKANGITILVYAATGLFLSIAAFL
jgi:1,4-dihydroxy-2-naphthoate octaprenyltransferase